MMSMFAPSQFHTIGQIETFLAVSEVFSLEHRIAMGNLMPRLTPSE